MTSGTGERFQRVAPVVLACLAIATAAGADDPCLDPVAALPEALRSRYAAAEQLLRADDAESAADYIELLLIESPRSVAVLELGAQVFTAFEEEERAAELLATLAEICPERQVDLYGSAPAGPLDPARERYQQVLGARTTKDRARLLPGAITAYEEALEQGIGGDQGAEEARHALAVLYLLDERLESSRAAYAWLERHAKLHAAEVPEYLRVLRTLAGAGRGAERLAEAERVLTAWRSRLDARELGLAARHLGFTALQLERHDLARDAFTTALEQVPDDRESHYGLAVVLEYESRRLRAAGDRQRGDRLRREAIEHARRAIDHPRYGEAARALLARLQFEG